MTPYIDQPVLAGSDLLLQLLFRETTESLTRPVHVLLPDPKRGVYEERLCGHRIPPVASSCSPVSQEESSDARNTAMGAMSPTLPVRPRGACAIRDFSSSEPRKPAV